MTAAGPAHAWQDVLTPDHLRQIFAVLEAAHDVPSGSTYRETLVDALARVFGVRGTTFFCGETYDDMFKDPDPTLQGIGEKLMQNYRERWSEKDIFALPSARRVLDEHGFITVDQIPHLPAAQREYFAGQLVPHGLGRAAALHLRFADGAAILGLFDDERRWPPPDILAMQTLARHLQSNARTRSMRQTQPHVDLDRVLSPRLREVASLVGQGLTNAEIAERLTVTEATAKKYISRIFDATGLTNRSMLAIAVHAQH